MFRKFARPFQIAVAALFLSALVPQVAQAQNFSDYVENKLVDLLVRGQAFTAPATVYVGLSTAACNDAGFGTEVTNANNYARKDITASLANWAGTQAAASTTASSGTGGVTSNNGVITFNVPSGSWGTVTHWFIADSGTHNTGNLLICDDLTTPQAIGSGNTVTFAIGALTITVQ
jgi:hypothetical protein